MQPSNNLLNKYHAEDFRRSLLAGAVLLSLVALLLFSNNFDALWEDFNAIACMVSAGLLGLAYYQFPQRPYALNISLGILYGLILLWEWIFISFPSAVNTSGAEVSKGILMDVLIWSLPGIYIGIRVILILPLVALWQRRWYNT